MIAYIKVIGEDGYEFFHTISNQKDFDKIKIYINNHLSLNDIIKVKGSD